MRKFFIETVLYIAFLGGFAFGLAMIVFFINWIAEDFKSWWKKK